MRWGSGRAGGCCKTGMASVVDEVEPPATMPALLAKICAERGEHPAVVTPGETATYAQLDRRTAQLARALLAAGAGKGARIALLAPDGVLWLTAFLAALRIGALVTLVSTLGTPPELAHILRHSDCQLLIAARRFLRHDYAATLAAALPGLETAEASGLQLPAAPYLRSIWLDDAKGLTWATPIAELLTLADSPGAPSAALLAAVEREVAPSDEAIVVYTSGSTAQPKAVVHRHWALARHSPELARTFALKPNDRMMVLLPLFWLAGLSSAMQVLSIGATLVYPETPDIDAALAMIGQFDVTRVNAWGDRQPLLVKAAGERGMGLSHIPDLSGFRDETGELLPPKVPMFGMTETFSAHSAWPLGHRLPPGKEDSFGRAIGGYERRVIDPDTGRVVPPGEAGELQVRGPSLMAGLYKQRRSDVFTPNGFYPTGDLVRIDAEGWLFPAGRLGDRIKTRAANVSRLEVEAALLALPEVDMAVVAGLPDADAGELVVAAVVPAEGTAPTEQNLRKALRATLSSYKVPRHIVFVCAEDIPRTATGKVRLSQLAAMIGARIGQSKLPSPVNDA
jgi:acyl-CoA synthetase (AMP-forming)/AMP-acid ligase II